MSLYVTKLNNNITFEMNYDIFERFRYFKILELEKKNAAYIMDRINQDLSVLSFIKTNVLFPEMNHELRHSFDKIYGSIRNVS